MKPAKVNNRRIAELISVIFHPLLVPTYTYYIITVQFSPLVLRIPAEMQNLIGGLVFTTTAILPATMMLLMLRLKFIGSLRIPLRSERPAPILITLIFFFLAYYMLRQLQVAPLFYYYMLGATALGLLCFLINLFYKISLHMAALGGATGSFIGLAFLLSHPMLAVLSVAIIVSGLTAFARLSLESHRPSEVYLGYVSGLVFMMGVFYLIS